MMMKTKGVLQLFAVAAVMALGANAAEAARAATPSSEDTHQLRVVNNSLGPVWVYVQDADGRMHRLSKVARAEAEVMEVPAEVAAAGAFRIKVFPDAPVWSPWASVDAIGTRDLVLPQGTAINLWLEADLRDSKVEIPAVTTTAEPTGGEGPDPAVTEVRVVNNHATGVRLVAQDAEGHVHILGHVSAAGFAFLELDTDVVRKGAVTIKVFPVESPFSLTGQSTGIKSVNLEVEDGSAIDVFVGSELTASSIKVTRGDQD